MEELKPCPFCGEIPKIFHDRHSVECCNGLCDVMPSTWSYTYDTDEDAVEAWNRRASDG